MENRTNISSGAKWEEIVGYSRAVRIGNCIEVSGTTAVDHNGDVVGIDNPYEQTRFILSKIGKALEQAGTSFENVIRTRIYVTNISCWEEIGKAHGEVFRTIKPAATMLQVSKLIDPLLLVEIEVSAIF